MRRVIKEDKPYLGKLSPQGFTYITNLERKVAENIRSHHRDFNRWLVEEGKVAIPVKVLEILERVALKSWEELDQEEHANLFASLIEAADALDKHRKESNPYSSTG